ncbi:hypothetical protein ABZW10_20375 [Kitasatospora sp. NPDC004723]|uniref:hypothetical protein n=1 Tax=Kitasatospora sp. NPDC004723 TaxID=3154288 RepID=UPI0033A1ECB2
MDCEEVMLTVRITAAERALLRALARGHGTDVSDVVVDGLLDVIPGLHVLPVLPVPPAGRVLPAVAGDPGVSRLLRVLARPAPCAVTLWLPAPVADLLPLVGERIAAVSGLRIGPASAALAAALGFWLTGDPGRLAAGLAGLHRHGAPRLAVQRLDVAA